MKGGDSLDQAVDMTWNPESLHSSWTHFLRNYRLQELIEDPALDSQQDHPSWSLRDVQVQGLSQLGTEIEGEFS